MQDHRTQREQQQPEHHPRGQHHQPVCHGASIPRNRGAQREARGVAGCDPAVTSSATAWRGSALVTSPSPTRTASAPAAAYSIRSREILAVEPVQADVGATRAHSQQRRGARLAFCSAPSPPSTSVFPHSPRPSLILPEITLPITTNGNHHLPSFYSFTARMLPILVDRSPRMGDIENTVGCY